ncbi:MAG: VWA domain-containing protein [Acidobacteria bacterium]|nr:VWA domain-containing protein [Acidobacteriota bacterium]MCL5289400.1 VWA domain-containing protein [Acidobacteriota bacterium]
MATNAKWRRAGVGVLFLLLATPLRAQKPELQTDPEFRLRRTVDVVSVDVAVTDARGNYLGDLKRENFRVLEDGTERPITNFASSEAPALVLVLVETGPAVYMIQQQHLGATRTLLEGLGAQDWVAFATYGQAPRVQQIFTQQKSEVLSAMRGMGFSAGASEVFFFKSLSTVLDWLEPVPGRKSLVVLTTGLDTEQPRRREALAEKLRASDVVVYPIALGGSLRSFRKAKRPDMDEGTSLSFAQADRDLREIARLTGGHAYFPKRAQDFSGVYREISSAVRQTYNLGFAPAARDGQFHKIDVQVVDAKGRVIAAGENPKRGYQVRARQGYVAAQQ